MESVPPAVAGGSINHGLLECGNHGLLECGITHPLPRGGTDSITAGVTDFIIRFARILGLIIVIASLKAPSES